MTAELAKELLEAALDELAALGESTANARFALDFFTISAASRSAAFCAGDQ